MTPLYVFRPHKDCYEADGKLEAVVEESRTYGIRGEEGSLPGWGWEQKETDIYKVHRMTRRELMTDSTNS